ncbi:MAG: glycosyltransferase family 9 protein [Planctomycetes bacterium]|nr:glycosyltransferase family 9 protein [Planctomycetota bacterium]
MPMSEGKYKRVERYAHRVLAKSVLGVKRITGVFRKDSSGLPENPRKILVVKLWGMGELLCASPAMASIRRAWPEAEITLLTARGLEGLYRPGELFTSAIPWDADRIRAIPGAVRVFRERARREEYDLAINLDGLCDMACLLTHAAGAKATVGFVPRDGSKRGYLKPVRIDASAHATDTFFGITDALGIDRAGEEVIAPQLTSNETIHAASSLANWGVDEHVMLIGINIDSREDAVGRALPPAKYVLLAQAIEEMGGYKTVFFGSADEERFVIRHSKPMETHPINLVGRTSSRQMAALLTRMHLVIGSNTGPLQLAAALGVPSLSILTSEKARWLCPPESEQHALIVRDPDPGKEISLDQVRGVLNDMLDHLADPENPPWMEG